MSHGPRYPATDSELVLYRVLQRANLIQYYEAFVSQGDGFLKRRELLLLFNVVY